jgi:STE24 endopeptidase
VKNLVGLILAVFFALFVLTVFVPYPPARVDAERYFTPQEIERGLEYSFERRLLFWGASAVELGFLLIVGLTSVSRRLADVALRIGRGYWLPAVLLVGGTCHVAAQALRFPFSLGSFFLTRAWGLTQRGVEPWFQEYLLAQGVELLLGGVVVACLYLLLRYFPRWWWFAATLGAGLLAALVAFLLPIVIAPLFNTFTPLSQTKWAALEPRIRALVAEAGVAVHDVLVMDASRQGSHTNAYFTGFGPTRRIVLYDTLLQQHTPAEVESILAHELGHWRHQHILKGIGIGMLASLAGLFLLDRILRRIQARAPWRLQSLADPAGLPLILLLVNLATWLALPLENAISRTFERQADATALELAGRPEVFITAEQRLARDNISNVAPTPWNVWLFATHPTPVQRIEMAREWQVR